MMKLVKRNLLIVYLIVAVLLSGVVFAMLSIVDKMPLFDYEHEMNTDKDEVVGILCDAMTVEQSFVMPCDKISGVDLCFGTYGRINPGTMKISLIQEGMDDNLIMWEQKNNIVQDNQVLEIRGDEIQVEKGRKYILRITSDNKDAGLAVYSSKEDAYLNGKLLLNGVEQDGDMYFSIIGRNNGCYSKKLFFFPLLGLFVIIAIMIYIRQTSDAIVETNNIFKIEWICLGAIMLLFCVIFAQQGDLYITILQARDLLSVIIQGKIGDFYTIVMEKALSGGYESFGAATSITYGAYYNILIYLCLGIIIAPMVLISKIFPIVFEPTYIVMYTQFILALLDLLSAYVLYRLICNMGFSKERAQLGVFVYLSSFMLLFSTIGFGQLDIIPILFMLWALCHYVKKEYTKFALVISIAIAIKAFAILIFIPLLLLVEKRVVHIIKYSFMGLCATIFNVVLYGNNYGYYTTKNELEKIYGFTSRLFKSKLEINLETVSIFIVIVALVCIYAYNKTDDSAIWKHTIEIPLIVFGSFFIFVEWHPQWIAILAPFTGLAVAMAGNQKVVLYCEMFLGLFYVLASNYAYPMNADNYMINKGILPVLTGHYYDGITIAQFFRKIDYLPQVLFSCLMAVTIAFVYYVGSYLKKTNKDSVKSFHLDRVVLWIRLMIPYIYVLFLMFCFFYI